MLSSAGRSGQSPQDARAALIAEQEAFFPSRDLALFDTSFDPLDPPAYGSLRPRTATRRIDVGPYGPPDRPPDTPGRAQALPVRATLVARDWKGGMVLVGNGIVPTDHFRMSRSMRMLVGRITLGDGLLVPFAHLGLGEWRYDTELLPDRPQNQEYAAQLSMGFRLRLAERAAVAWETGYTLLCRDRREPQNLPTPRVLSSSAVLQFGF